MRSTFGIQAQRERNKRGISQSTFAELVNESLSRISQLEHQRTKINDEVIAKYIDALVLGPTEADQLRRAAEFSNARLAAKKKDLHHDSLHALLTHVGDKLSDKTVAGIRSLILGDLDPELSSEVSCLQSASTLSKGYSSRGQKRLPPRPTLYPRSFVRICLAAAEHRKRFTDSSGSKLDIEQLLAQASEANENFDLEIVDGLPLFAKGAFACIVGSVEGHTVFLTENAYKMATRGKWFIRHVICHEYGHHVLHGHLLNSTSKASFPIQVLARENSDQGEVEGDIKQVVDTIEEVEAECFATMLLVPWEEFLRGKPPHLLAKDYGAWQDEVERYAAYFKNQAVINSFREELWARGEREHNIFHINPGSVH